MTLTVEHVLYGIYIAVGVMLIVALYHLILILVDVRKITRKFESVSEHVQTIIEAPLMMMEKGVTWVTSAIESATEKKQEHHHHKKND